MSEIVTREELDSDIAMLRRAIFAAYKALDDAENEFIRRFNERVDRSDKSAPSELAPQNAPSPTGEPT